MMEGVQRRATKMIPSLRKLSIEKVGYVFSKVVDTDGAEVVEGK